MASGSSLFERLLYTAMDSVINLLLLVTGKPAYNLPADIPISFMLLFLQQVIISPIEQILTVSGITISVPTEVSRLYFGYSGNLREQVN